MDFSQGNSSMISDKDLEMQLNGSSVEKSSPQHMTDKETNPKKKEESSPDVGPNKRKQKIMKNIMSLKKTQNIELKANLKDEWSQRKLNQSISAFSQRN